MAACTDLGAWLAGAWDQLSPGADVPRPEAPDGDGERVDWFLARIWEHVPLYMKKADAHGFSSILRLEDIDALLCRTALPNTAAELLMFESQRQVTNYSTPHAAFASGASIVINHTDKVWAPLCELCTRLAAVFRHTYCNLYFTPAVSQTAPAHTDDRDVFVLQLHGTKAIAQRRIADAPSLCYDVLCCALLC
jgi:ribosomal protein L16 Arg81 hydroxylase